ncbi:Spy0128 family protein [Streptococcus suis]|uniref:Spy0128 family protein n=1 Tax=Streptococcus suis TaxID=1307 RepID=UPI001EFF55E0|nr:FctA domain-containing protein [Streptococcus suis]MCG9871954.1 LPXTG cell wall anchor domain-containing protein [Streptococcus suis]MCG9918491.1 LPXTG cell wall anchor domain-containing protein [Streptococcus suis]MCG9920032.1 LPXTG cell wall anchor domain-containing protein [Streptococcus suis]MCG9924250.1 LPXTG cell wall anchor domain-containing protein [Streptococcus suis]MCG9926260.1 LPXTG cell wall anchor domain-containing protein [Streptococcus suis]
MNLTNGRKQAAYDTLVVHDTVNMVDYSPMQFIPEKFKVIAGWYDSEYRLLDQAELTKDQYTLTFNESYTDFVLTIPNAKSIQKNGKPAAFRIEYKTTAPADGTMVANKVEVSGNGTLLTIDDDRTDISQEIVANSRITSGGTIQLTTGYRITLYKVDSKTQNRLSGAKFKITPPVGATTAKEEVVTTNADGVAQSPIYTEADVKLGEFTITEVEAPEGYELDPTPIKVTVGKAGVIKTIKNKRYTTTAQITARKRLLGRELNAGEFEFVLTDQQGREIETVKNDLYGDIKFKELTFDKEGNYNFTIKEKNANTSDENGITYDEQPVEVAVVVSKDSTGKLTSTVSYANDDNEFNNFYTPSPVDVELEVTKKLTGRKLIEGEFEFVLTENRFPDPTPSRMPARNTVIPTENIVRQKVTNTADGKVKFAPITYDHRGAYQYTIEETNAGKTIDGVTYDSLKVEVTVVVTDDGKGRLVAEVFYSKNTEFNNIYKTSKAKAELAVKKTLTGRELKEDEFEFVLKNKANEEVATAKNDKDGNVKFKELTFDKAGTYTYTISEKNGGTTDKGVTYDGKTITATVTVTDNGSGELSAAVSYSDETPFNNTYAVSGTRAELAVKKTLTGRELKEDEFEFVLKNKANEEVATAKNDKDGNVKFKELTFDKAGTYTYTVTEKNGGTTDKGVTYDGKTITATVTVTDNGSGELSAAVSYSDETPFNNTYAVSSTRAELAVKKTLTGRELKEDEFEFVLKNEANEEVATAKNDKDGNVKFKELTFDKAGTYTYTVTEVVGGDTAIIYDSLKIKVTVVVTDDGEGKLIAKVEYPEDIEFNNEYVEPTTTTTTEEPTTTTTTEEPTTTTTTEEPTTTTTTEEPTTTTTTEEPTTTTTTEEPTTTTTTEEPTTTTTTEEPTTTTTTEEPMTTTTTEEPMTTITSEKTRKTALPSTGDKGNIWVAIAGFVALITIVVMVYYRKSKNA